MQAERPRELRPLFKLMLEEGSLDQVTYEALIAVLDRFDPNSRPGLPGGGYRVGGVGGMMEGR